MQLLTVVVGADQEFVADDLGDVEARTVPVTMSLWPKVP